MVIKMKKRTISSLIMMVSVACCLIACGGQIKETSTPKEESENIELAMSEPEELVSASVIEPEIIAEETVQMDEITDDQGLREEAALIEESIYIEEAAQVDIVMVGDILLHTRVNQSGLMEDGTYNYDHMFAQVKADIEAADLA